jgi:hypothetical protein
MPSNAPEIFCSATAGMSPCPLLSRWTRRRASRDTALGLSSSLDRRRSFAFAITIPLFSLSSAPKASRNCRDRTARMILGVALLSSDAWGKASQDRDGDSCHSHHDKKRAASWAALVTGVGRIDAEGMDIRGRESEAPTDPKPSTSRGNWPGAISTTPYLRAGKPGSTAAATR